MAKSRNTSQKIIEEAQQRNDNSNETKDVCKIYSINFEKCAEINRKKLV